MAEKGIGAPTVEDSGTDTSLGLALERKPKALLSVPPGASKPSQNNDVDIIGNEETPGLFEDLNNNIIIIIILLLIARKLTFEYDQMRVTTRIPKNYKKC